MKPVPRLQDLAIVIAGTAAILSVAVFNGFPLVYSDTGTYLRSAFTGFVPDDRPYWYGLFIRITSLGGRSLWGVVIAQSALCALLLWRCWQLLGDGRWWTYLITLTVLAPITGLGWYAGQLVADIFPVIGVLAMTVFLFTPEWRWSLIGLLLLVVFACWVHLSDLLILPLVFVSVVLALRLTGRAIPFRRGMGVGLALLLAWTALPVANKAVSGEAHLSRYSHVFMMSRLVETGMLKTWLDEHCDTDPARLCYYKDDLPRTNKAFMWGGESPLALEGGGRKVKEEYDRIIRATWTEPKYIGMHILGSLRSTAELLGLWRIADELEGQFYRMDYSAPYGSINSFVPEAMPAYLGSAQNTGAGTLGLRYLDRAYQLVLAISLLTMVILLIRSASRKTSAIALMIGGSTMLWGAWVCASLSTVDSRFMGRTAWLLPVMVALLIWKGQQERPTRNNNSVIPERG
ncbi:MAG: hypothetical protein H6592_13745 [Flavobacteriales bacterium]|nr:hypothetical protein [Flavobacteriales bacterium]